jgi:hypothetical protein
MLLTMSDSYSHVSEVYNDSSTSGATGAYTEDVGIDATRITVPTFGGIMKTTYGDKDHVFAWSGTDPDL